MKRRITLSIALVLSIVLVSMTRSDSMVEAESQLRYKFDTGIVKTGPGQLLHVTAAGALDLNDLYFRVNRQRYTQDACNGGVCKLVLASQTTSIPIMLMPGEAAAIAVDPSDPTGNTYVRGVVLSNSRNVRVNALIINSLTGEVTSHIIVAQTEGDIH